VLFKAGLQWCVGNGGHIRIWNDKWLSSTTGHHTIIHRGGLRDDARVMDLINWETKAWKTSMVRDLFGAEIADGICQIPLGTIHNEDRQI